MPNTPRGYPYPANTDGPVGPAQMQSLALAVDTDITSGGALSALDRGDIDGQDLNTVTSAGTYTAPGGNNLNAPVLGGRYILTVYKATNASATGTYTRQVYTVVSSGLTWSRVGTLTTWTPWALSCVTKQFTATTDSNGLATVAHGLGWAPGAVTATANSPILGGTSSAFITSIMTDSYTSTTFRIRAINDDGTQHSGPVTFSATFG